jgi:hypothetical protein
MAPRAPLPETTTLSSPTSLSLLQLNPDHETFEPMTWNFNVPLIPSEIGSWSPGDGFSPASPSWPWNWPTNSHYDIGSPGDTVTSSPHYQPSSPLLSNFEESPQYEPNSPVYQQSPYYGPTGSPCYEISPQTEPGSSAHQPSPYYGPTASPYEESPKYEPVPSVYQPSPYYEPTASPFCGKSNYGPSPDFELSLYYASQNNEQKGLPYEPSPNYELSQQYEQCSDNELHVCSNNELTNPTSTDYDERIAREEQMAMCPHGTMAQDQSPPGFNGGSRWYTSSPEYGSTSPVYAPIASQLYSPPSPLYAPSSPGRFPSYSPPLSPADSDEFECLWKTDIEE